MAWLQDTACSPSAGTQELQCVGGACDAQFPWRQTLEGDELKVSLSLFVALVLAPKVTFAVRSKRGNLNSLFGTK